MARLTGRVLLAATFLLLAVFLVLPWGGFPPEPDRMGPVLTEAAAYRHNGIPLAEVQP